VQEALEESEASSLTLAEFESERLLNELQNEVCTCADYVESLKTMRSDDHA